VFPPPDRILARAVARLPNRFRRPGACWVNPDGSALDSFLEAPVIGPEGALYFVDILNGRIHRWSGGEIAAVAAYDGQPNGLKFARDGRLHVADFKNGLMQCDVSSGSMAPLLERAGEEGFKGLNDLIFDRAGRLFFTDQRNTGLQVPTGRVYRLDGDRILRLLLSNVPSPNGIALSPDDRVLYLAVICANQVWRTRLDAAGRIGKVGVYVQLAGRSGGPDGIAVDERGNLVVAQIGSGIVWLFGALGEPLLRIDCTEGRMPSNIAFGGPERRTLYITEAESGTILAAEMPYPGAEVAASGLEAATRRRTGKHWGGHHEINPLRRTRRREAGND
jgi:gluconolactonase